MPRRGPTHPAEVRQAAVQASLTENVQSVAARFGVSYYTLKGWRQRAGVTGEAGRPQEYTQETMAEALAACRKRAVKVEAIAMQYGVPVSTLRYWRRKAGLEKKRGER